MSTFLSLEEDFEYEYSLDALVGCSRMCLLDVGLGSKMKPSTKRCVCMSSVDAEVTVIF